MSNTQQAKPTARKLRRDDREQPPPELAVYAQEWRSSCCGALLSDYAIPNGGWVSLKCWKCGRPVTMLIPPRTPNGSESAHAELTAVVGILRERDRINGAQRSEADLTEDARAILSVVLRQLDGATDIR